MELLQLKYFHTVALYGSITDAAKALHISQPSLSIMISRLEKDLGVPLFDRKGRGIVLNTYGHIMLEHTSNILKELDKAVYRLNLLMEHKERELNFCSNSKGITAALLKNFIGDGNSYNIRQRSCGIIEAEEMLLKNDYHFAVTTPPLNNEELNTLSLFNGTIVCVVSKTHALAQHKQLTVEQIKDEKFFSLFTNEIARPQRRKKYEQYLGFMPNIIFEGEKDVILNLVSENRGILLTIQYPFMDEYGNNFKVIPIAGIPADFKIGLSWKKENENSAPIQDFLQYIHRILATEVSKS